MSVVLSGIGCPFFRGFCVLNLPHKLTGMQIDFSFSSDVGPHVCRLEWYWVSILPRVLRIKLTT